MQATWRITASVLTPDKVGQGKVKKVNSDLGQGRMRNSQESEQQHSTTAKIWLQDKCRNS